MNQSSARVVSKYRIQMQSNGLLQQQNTGLHHYKKSAQNNTNTETKTK